MSRRVPGTTHQLVEERDGSGRLRTLTLAGRVYLRTDDDGTRRFDGGIAMSELAVGHTLFRRVTTPAATWTETYRVDEDGRPVHVDGVDVRRDPRNRVVACGDWRYAYAGEDLAAIESPNGVRHVTRDGTGRPVRAREGVRAVGLAYDDDGRRIDVPAPPDTWQRDELGRVWTVARPDGGVATTYLWDGFACLGRIDGPPGGPLAAVFSLDPTCTPVRVIEGGHVLRIPRDAFGEALLAHPGVPGLFGGAQHEGFVHYAARPLDPLTGAWTDPDPWSGLARDPRRADGYRGTLLVEKGPYTVCLGDPVGRVDHTGEASAGLILSTLTWSWQNNLVGWLAMDFFLNFWASLFGAIGDPTIWDRFASFTGLSGSEHIGAFGVRRDSVLWAKNGGSRAWTYQHMVWANEEHFEELQDVQVFTPGAPFEPRSYGSLIHLRPVGKATLAIVGDGSTGGLRPSRPAADWTRGMSRDEDGRSRARPLWEGSLTSSFPSGPLHLDSAVAGMRGELAASAAELVPSEAFGVGTIEPRAVLAIEGTGLALAEGATVYFGNGEGVISRVLSVEESGGRTLVRIEDDATAVTAAGARIRAVARQSEEDVPRGAAPEHLDVVGSSTASTPTPNDYDVGDLLRFSTGTTQLGARRLLRFEARITVDAALPAAVTAPLTVRTMTVTPGGNGTLTADPLRIRIPAGAPAVGSAIAVTRGPTVLPVFLAGVDPADAKIFIVDRELYTGASLDGTPVTWQRLSPGTDLTTDAPLPAGVDLTYEPGETRRAPAAGFIGFESAGGRTLRTVTGRAYDALVLHSAVPGVADPVHVERFSGVAGGADVAVAAVTIGGALSVQAGQQLFAADADTSRLVVQLVGLGSPTLAAGTALTLPAAPPPPPAPVFGAQTMTLVYPGLGGRDTNIAPSSPVLLTATAGGAIELNVVRELWLTFALDRALPAVGGNLRVATLDVGSFGYTGVRVGGTTLTVLPTVAGTGRVQMPQFWAGELIRVGYTIPAGAQIRNFRVVSVDGSTLELAEDLPIEPDAAAPGVVITVARLQPTDPLTGGPWRAIDGAVVPGPGNRIRVRTWRASEFGVADALLAIVDGQTAHPARVAAGPVTLEIGFVVPPAAPDYTVSMPNPAFGAYVTDIRREDDAYLILSALPPGATANPQDLAAAITYTESTPAVDGELAPGTVLVPDNESLEVDRRQSLVDHELTHTNQSARWGPMMLCFLPIQLLMVDRLVDLIPGVDAPEFSQYLPGTLRRNGSLYQLTAANAGGVTFATGNQVEISLAHVVLRVELGAKTDEAFAVIANDATELAAGLVDGVPEGVQVRLQRSPGFWGHSGRNLQSLLHLSTHGGVLNLTVGSTYGALLGLLARLVYAAGRSIFTSTQDFPAQVVEDGSALRLTTDPGKTAFRTERRVAIAASSTLVRAISGREEEGALLRLVGAIPATPADVRVSVYSTRNDDSSFDWHSYFPATVPDQTRPAQVRVDKVGESLSLAVGNEVWLRDGATTWHSKVVGATDEGTAILVDLAKPVARLTAAHDFRLAKVDAGSPGFDPDSPSTAFRDPLGFLSDDLMNLMGAGWMRWVINPWGEALGRLHRAVPDNTFWWKFLRVFTHVASTSLSTYGWSMMPPAFGWLLWDRELTGKEHQSYIEQEASSASGDLYSPAGRLFGVRSDGMVVGDVARYVYYQLGRKTSTLAGGRQDRPGVTLNTNPRVGIASAIPTPGRAVPDLLYQRQLASPYAIGDPADNTFAPDSAGFLPTSDRLERASAIHVAFTRPSDGGTHAATLSQGTASRDRAVESTDYQPAFFNLSVGDVTATVAGQTVTNDAPIRLVQGQVARVSVSPDTARRYRAALLRPTTGTILRLDAQDRIVAQPLNGTEAAQIDRVYEPEELQTHLRRRFVVPVREFDVTVVDAPPVLAALPASADGVFAGLADDPRPGDTVFILVPGAVQVALAVDPATLGGLTAPSVTVEATPAGLRDFVGDGAIYRVAFAATDTPAAPVSVTFRVTIRGDTPIPLQVLITVQPA